MFALPQLGTRTSSLFLCRVTSSSFTLPPSNQRTPVQATQRRAEVRHAPGADVRLVSSCCFFPFSCLRFPVHFQKDPTLHSIPSRSVCSLFACSGVAPTPRGFFLPLLLPMHAMNASSFSLCGPNPFPAFRDFFRPSQRPKKPRCFFSC